MLIEPDHSTITAIPPDVELVICRLDDDRDIPLATATDWLSPEERARVRRLRFPEDRKRFVRARGFLRRSLAERLGSDPATLVLGSAHGEKPFLQDGALSFNLSHSGDLAALAISVERELGIDIELLAPRRPRNLTRLIDACFRSDEAAAIRDAADPLRTFLHFWTAKEARMKLTGEGLILAPKAIALAHQDGRPISYLLPAQPAAALHVLDLRTAVGAVAVGAEGRHR